MSRAFIVYIFFKNSNIKNRVKIIFKSVPISKLGYFIMLF